MVRVTGGIYRGQMILVPDDHDVRPTTGRVREAVFNILGGQLSGAWILDLFAGSGLLGLEALSRGAESVTFVDSSPSACAIIQQNCDRLHCTHQTTVIKGSLTQAATLKKLQTLFQQKYQQSDKRLGIIFLDPPYGHGLVPEVLSSIGKFTFANPGTLAVAEHEALAQLKDCTSWEPLQYRRYGDTRISIFSMIGGKDTT